MAQKRLSVGLLPVGPQPTGEAVRQLARQTVEGICGESNPDFNVHRFETAFFNAYPAYQHEPNTVLSPDTPAAAALRTQLLSDVQQLQNLRPEWQTMLTICGQILADEPTLPALPSDLKVSAHVVIQGAGPVGLWMALVLGRLGISVDVVESRPEAVWADRYGSLSMKPWTAFLEALDLQAREWFLHETETVRFAPDDLYSPNALRATVGTYQRALRKSIATLPAGRVKLHFGETSAQHYVKPTTLLRVHAEGVGGRQKAFEADPSLAQKTGYEFHPELTTYAETAVWFTDEEVTGFIRSNQYYPRGGGLVFDHLRKHAVSNMGALSPVVDAQLRTAERYQVDPVKINAVRTWAAQQKGLTCPTMVYAMCSRPSADTPSRFPQALLHSLFEITPERLRQSFLPSEGAAPAEVYMGDASGPSHFIGGYGTSKAGQEIHQVAIYVGLMALIDEMQHSLNGGSTTQVLKEQDILQSMVKAVNGLLSAKLAQIVDRYYWISIVDALYHQISPTVDSPPMSPASPVGRVIMESPVLPQQPVLVQ